MSFQATVVQVMIAGPSDVADEKNAVRDALGRWNATNAESSSCVLLPMSWETHSVPELGDRPQKLINDQVLAHADVLVAIFWHRLGTPTGQFASGTLEEIDGHLQAGGRVLVYRCTRSVPSDVDTAQLDALRSAWSEFRKRGLCRDFDDPSALKEDLQSALSQIVRDLSESHRMHRAEEFLASVNESATLSDEAQQLLTQAADGGGFSIVTTAAGIAVQTNGGCLNDPSDPRSTATWRSAAEELVDEDLVNQESDGMLSRFTMTKKGYETADSLKAQTTTVGGGAPGPVPA